MKQIYIFLSILWFSSCKPQKTITEYRYINKTDTLVRSEVKTIYKGINDTITIASPCDSTGIINQFYSRIAIPDGTITISSNRKSNKLLATVNINDLVSTNKSQKESSTLEKIVFKDKEVRVPYIPDWIWYVLSATSILSFLYIKEKVSIFVK